MLLRSNRVRRWRAHSRLTRATVGALNVRVVRSRWQDLNEPLAEAVFAAHIVYAPPEIEAFVESLELLARRVVRGACVWLAAAVATLQPVAGGLWWRRLSNPSLPQLLEVLWSLGIYPDVTMLQVPIWPLGPWPRAQNGLRRRMRILPHSPADRRLEHAMTELRSKLDEAELAAAWKTGGAWSSNEAIDYALSLGSVLSRDC